MVLLLLLVGLAVIVGLFAIHILTFRSIQARGKSTLWTRGSSIAVIIGALTGFLSGILVRWRPEANVEYVGFPIPGMLLLYEGGRWVDYVGPTVLICPVLNAFLGATVFLLPFSVALLFRR